MYRCWFFDRDGTCIPISIPCCSHTVIILIFFCSLLIPSQRPFSPYPSGFRVSFLTGVRIWRTIPFQGSGTSDGFGNAWFFRSSCIYSGSCIFSPLLFLNFLSPLAFLTGTPASVSASVIGIGISVQRSAFRQPKGKGTCMRLGLEDIIDRWRASSLLLLAGQPGFRMDMEVEREITWFTCITYIHTYIDTYIHTSIAWTGSGWGGVSGFICCYNCVLYIQTGYLCI